MGLTMEMWLGLVMGGLPMLMGMLWWWNEIWYVLPLKLRCKATGTKLPPGHMGLPFFGELFSFLWYFKILRRPDEFIHSKRHRYGEEIEMYRTHLFGSPSIIACSPTINKFVLQSDDKFMLKWPNVDLVGRTSLVAVHGQSHARLRRFVTKAINQPTALSRIALLVQPRLVEALQSWSHKGTITAYDELKKVTFENIGKLFISMEPGPSLNAMEKLFQGMLKGMRAQPINFPGSAYYHASQCRKKLETIFRTELEKKKNQRNQKNKVETIDLMDGLMDIKDEEGSNLSDQEVIDNIASLVPAGYASTTLASMWAIYYLPKYPHVLQKLRDENMKIREKTGGDFISSEDVSKMKYTNKVVEETIRLANIAAFFFRSVTEDIYYKGYTIPKDWTVILWVRYLHTNSENFDDPMSFNPERWNEPPKPGTYQVFGGGQRICAGNMLARLQLSILLHHLSTKYKWELLNPDAEITYLPHPKPVDGVEIEINKI